MTPVRERPEGQKELTKVQVATRLLVGPRNVDHWLADGLAHRKDQKTGRVYIRWADALAFYVASRVRGGAKPVEGDNTPKARKAEAEARLAELDVQKAERALVDRAEAEHLTGELFAALAARLKAAAGQYSSRVLNVSHPREARKVLDQLTADVLREWEQAVHELTEEAA